MRISKGQLKKIIAEEVSRVISEMDVLNADTVELLAVDALPPKYAGRLTKADGYDALYNPDFEALRKDLTLDPDAALGMLKEEAAEMYGEVQGDLGTAIDMAMGLKMSFPKEWAAALTTRRIKGIVSDTLDDDEAYAEFEAFLDTQRRGAFLRRGAAQREFKRFKFRLEDYALARFLADRMG